jgi:quercetin dioxygenase-like cupin family protein
MVKKVSEQKTMERATGVGFHLFVEPEEIHGAGRLFGKITIQPGGCIAPHRHDDEMETFYVAKGICRMEDNGETVHLSQGDVLVTKCGDNHAVYNDTNEPVELIAFIASVKQGKPGSSTPL